ncbi:hypothetical protein [Sphingomonas kyeonggiensis]|uniref:DUF3617 family protein n=1 Tax=Sphingomonas kyeonggiensis TaxID=1268553 RepID=A0A7W6NVI4_9SPHN|nr:hypothetical protein [Sphingomonas kyeonggiensis]MBB4096594.1 hypothetical protein [Sphingomonas kyeonggiensis]
MPNPFLVTSSLLLLAAAPAAAPVGAPDWTGARFMLQDQQQQQRVVIQVPRVTITSSATIIVRRAPHLVEKKAKDCVKVQDISGFAGVNTQDSVDLVLRDGSLLRAKLGRKCQALGFYNGFYVKMNKDQKICAGRDSIRTRAGRSCDVEDFRKLAVER